MKTILNLFVIAALSFVFVSCSKNQFIENPPATTVVTDPVLASAIFNKTNDPAPIEFGGNTVINAGSRVAIYLPYVIANDVMQTSTITLTDATTEETLGTFSLLPSTDASAATLNIPTDLAYVPYLFAAIDIDNNYVGRSVTISTHLAGKHASSDQIMPNAFSVQ